jgi:hypothetical protein
MLDIHERTLTVNYSFSGTDVFGISPGTEPGVVLFTAHRDTVPTTEQGAVDDGSGVGAVLELARVLSPGPHRYTYVFAALDGEEYGMLGARGLMNRRPDYLSDIRLDINLDMVGFRANQGLLIRATEYLRPNALSLVNRLADETQSRLPEVTITRQPFREVDTDADQFKWRGVPALDLLDPNPRAYTDYHKPADTVDKLLPGPLERIGRQAEALVRIGDATRAFGPGQGLVLTRYRGDRYEFLPPWRLFAAGLCLLTVFLMPLVSLFWRLRRQVIDLVRAQWAPLTVFAVVVLLAALTKSAIFGAICAIVLAIMLRTRRPADAGLGRLLVAAMPALLFGLTWRFAAQWPAAVYIPAVALVPAVLVSWKPGWLWRTWDVLLMTILLGAALFPTYANLGIGFAQFRNNARLPEFIGLWILPFRYFSPGGLAAMAAVHAAAAAAAVWGLFARRPAAASAEREAQAA